MSDSTVIRLADESVAPRPGVSRLTAEMPLLGGTLRLAVDVPDGRSRLWDVADLAYAICDRLVERTLEHSAANGQATSCRAGCGQCCSRLMVVATPPEAFRIVSQMGSAPPAISRTIQAALAAAQEQLCRVPLVQVSPAGADDPAGQAAVVEAYTDWWRQLRIPCPFLIEGRCAAYTVRPCMCREYHFTGPVEDCTRSPEHILRPPVLVSQVLRRWSAMMEDAPTEYILLQTVDGWCGQRMARAGRTWKSAGMVRRFLDVLTEPASR